MFGLWLWQLKSPAIQRWWFFSIKITLHILLRHFTKKIVKLGDKRLLLSLKMKYVTIISYLFRIRKASISSILQDSLSKFTRLHKTNKCFTSCPCLISVRQFLPWFEKEDFFQHLMEEYLFIFKLHMLCLGSHNHPPFKA